MITYGATCKGRRKENQDRYLIYKPTEKTAFLAVADGMGGVVGGGIASQLVIDTTEQVIKNETQSIDGTTDLKLLIIKIYSEAQAAVAEKIRNETMLQGMGSTLSCILIHDDRFVWGNLGDSRIYHFTEDMFVRITKDHTQIEEYASSENKEVSQEMVSNFGHLLTRTINGGGDKPDIYPKSTPFLKLKSGEGFVLCSDGLLINKYGNDEERFYKCFVETETLNEFVENLITNTYEMGSEDNITCISAFNGKIKPKINLG